MKKYILFIAFLLVGIQLFAQENTDKIIVSGFKISGNDKTKDETIIRELDVAIGDSIDFNNLSYRLGTNQTLLLNTGLFYNVKMNIADWDAYNHVVLVIDVKEAWYLFPVPIFELADRNFSVWRSQYNYSFKRLDYGMKVYHSNLTGRRDRLKGVLQFGFTQKYELQYEIPAINKAKTIGLYTNLLFTRNKELHYTTENSKQQFYRSSDEQVLFKRYRAELGIIYRPKLFKKHTFKLRYYQKNIADSVAILNPDFFLEGRTQQREFDISYTYSWDKRDLRIYPTKGFYISGSIEQNGLGIFRDRNSTLLGIKAAQYIPLDKKNKWSLELLAHGRIRLQSEKQPFYNNTALGYFEDFLRGYEYYVIDGTNYGYLKSSLRYELVNKTINWKKAMPFKAFKKMPLRMYLTLNSDTGYVKESHYKTQNPLSNQMLWGGGVGLDVIFYVDKVIRFEYSMNHKKERDLFIHFKLFF